MEIYDEGETVFTRKVAVIYVYDECKNKGKQFVVMNLKRIII